MALPVLPLLAAGLLGYAEYRAARTAVDAAGRERRRRDWFVVQDPEAVAAGEGQAARGGGGAGLADRREWLGANAPGGSWEFEDGAVRFERQGDAPLRRAVRLGRAADAAPGGADALGPAGGPPRAGDRAVNQRTGTRSAHLHGVLHPGRRVVGVGWLAGVADPNGGGGRAALDYRGGHVLGHDGSAGRPVLGLGIGVDRRRRRLGLLRLHGGFPVGLPPRHVVRLHVGPLQRPDPFPGGARKSGS
jgi:hypothetical protein